MGRLYSILGTIGKGIVQAIGIVMVIFVLCRVVPGDVVDLMGVEGDLTVEQAEAMRQEMGLDRSMVQQFGDWVANGIHGDFGKSLRFDAPVSDMLLGALPVTLKLASLSFAIGLGVEAMKVVHSRMH